MPFVADDPYFALTYGDGVANIDLPAQIAFHEAHALKATVTAVRPAKRFGAISIENGRVSNFREKPEEDGGWINGGFFLLSSDIKSYIKGDETIWEREPMEQLAQEQQLGAYVHRGFWHPMDTLRDRNYLEDEWVSGRAQWRVW
jgi:glucose-1-phosphate cytidylyltransferase